MLGFHPISYAPVSALVISGEPGLGLPGLPPVYVPAKSYTGGSADSGATILDNRRKPWRGGGSEEPEYTPRFYRTTAYGLLRFSGRFSVWMRQEPAPRQTAIGQFSIKARCAGSFRDRLKVVQDAEELVLSQGGLLTKAERTEDVLDPLQWAREEEDLILIRGDVLGAVQEEA